MAEPDRTRSGRVPDWARGLFAALDAFDADAFVAQMTDQVRHCPPGIENVGRDAVRQSVTEFQKIVKAVRHKIVDSWDRGPTTLLTMEVDYTILDGRAFRIPGAVLVHREGELIDELLIFANLEPLFAEGGGERS